MTGSNQTDLSWRGEVPVSAQFDDPYFSAHDGLAETSHVFHAGNGLPGRFTPDFQIAELGFGTGLNLLATTALWQATGQSGTLNFTSFEAFPLPVSVMTRALAQFPTLSPLAEIFLPQWEGGERQIALPGVQVTIVHGDARETLPQWSGRADAWFLDGFSPARNPELWSDALLMQVAAHTCPKGTFATYTAAGHVRRALQAAGFQVSRIPGHANKRHMSAEVLIP